jgi:hypothetical protein
MNIEEHVAAGEALLSNAASRLSDATVAQAHFAAASALTQIEALQMTATQVAISANAANAAQLAELREAVEQLFHRLILRYPETAAMRHIINDFRDRFGLSV